MGVAGLIVDPLRGAQKEGVGGFFKGVGKGLLGVVAKPTSGVLGLSTQTLKGLGNTPTFLLTAKVASSSRRRPPRHMQPGARIEVYDRCKAEHQQREWEARRKGTSRRTPAKSKGPRGELQSPGFHAFPMQDTEVPAIPDI
jgi:vacuolar protein sorting-associated protein 13A/C